MANTDRRLGEPAPTRPGDGTVTRLTDQERIWRSVPESDVVRGIIEHFRFRGGYAFRNNTGGGRFSNPGSDSVRYVQFSEPGAADVIGVFEGRAYFFEAKTELGKVSELQHAWRAQIEAVGGIWRVCRPSDFTDVIDHALGLA